MVCIEKIYSVSALVGNGACNANCDFCAGKYLRPDAKETPLYYRNLEAAIKLSARYGGWSFSLTSSGEPTCTPDSVTRALEVYKKCADQGAFFPNVNLFTNGIDLEDKDFCKTYLPLWKDLGLTNVAISIHSEDEKEQAEASIYELTPQKYKLDIGKLIDLNHKKIIIYTQRYGASGNLIDYVVKPTQKPDIKKIINGYLK